LPPWRRTIDTNPHVTLSDFEIPPRDSQVMDKGDVRVYRGRIVERLVLPIKLLFGQLKAV
jgi:hypothetical protein